MFAEFGQYCDSTDFLSFLKKPKSEIVDLPQEDQENEQVWPAIRKRIEPCSMQSLMPNLEKSSKVNVVQETKVKVHFLGLKKVRQTDFRVYLGVRTCGIFLLFC